MRFTSANTVVEKSVVKLATSDEEILECFPVMQELRPHLHEESFVSRIRRQQEAGYQLAYCCEDAVLVGVAGFRLGENLAWGRFLYVDDLVTAQAYRSKGYGSLLLSWLKRYAWENGCDQLHLDSGIQRKDAHRFYEREKMIMGGYHFAIPVSED